MPARRHLSKIQQHAAESPRPQLPNISADTAEMANTSSVRVRCQGFKATGTQCRRTCLASPGAAQSEYCMLHRSQAAASTAAPLRRCDGFTADGSNCTRPLPNGPTDRPVFCKLHTDQSHLVEYVRCFGKSSDGSPCGNHIRWDPPYLQFCPQHASQAPSFGSPVTSLPYDVAALIIAALSPIDRVAFALANRSCAALVRACAPSIPAKHVEAQSLTIRTYNSRHFFKLTTPCEKCGVVEYMNPYFGRHYRNSEPHTGEVYNFHDPPQTITLSPCRSCKSCRCPGYALRRFPFEHMHRYRDRHLIDKDHFIRALMRKHPFFFSATLGRCISCNSQLTAEDSCNWTNVICRRSDRKKSAFLERMANACDPANNPETLLCSRCSDVSIVFEWCRNCHGKVSHLAVIRAYLKNQVPQRQGL